MARKLSTGQKLLARQGCGVVIWDHDLGNSDISCAMRDLM